MSDEKQCPDCDTEMYEFDSGFSKANGYGREWKAYKCPDCGYIESTEPDPDE